MKMKKLAAGLTALALSVTELVTPLSENFSGILDGLFDKISYSADASTNGGYVKVYGDFEFNVIDDGTIGTILILYHGSEAEITIPGVIDDVTVTDIADFAFESCRSLKNVTISDGLINIDDNAFYDCTNLESITIPDSVKSIGDSAFYECMSLKDVYYTGTEEEWNNIYIRVNNNYLKRATIHYNYDPNHSHSYTSEVTTPATCTSDGVITHTCSCGDSYTETIKATGHSYTTTVVAPTYAEQGYTLHKCSKCSDSYKDTYTAQLVLGNVSGLKTTANTPTSISMSWTKATGATGYVVYQAINGKWQRIKVTSGNTLTVSGLKSGTNYRFTVKAYKTVSGKNYYCAGYTGVWMTTTPAKPSAKMTVNTPQAIRLEWGKVTGATGYVVYQQVNGAWVKKATTTNNVYVATGLKSGTNYNFAVRAYRTFNGKNYYSPFATATDTIKTCTKPATVNFTLTAGTKKATVNWSKVTGATGYIVYYKTSANGSWQKLTTTTGTTYTKTGLTIGKTYYFTVKAYKTFNGATYNAGFTTKSVKVK